MPFCWMFVLSCFKKKKKEDTVVTMVMVKKNLQHASSGLSYRLNSVEIKHFHSKY